MGFAAHHMSRLKDSACGTVASVLEVPCQTSEIETTTVSRPERYFAVTSHRILS
jgi:hypothetical protein